MTVKEAREALKPPLVFGDEKQIKAAALVSEALTHLGEYDSLPCPVCDFGMCGCDECGGDGEASDGEECSWCDGTGSVDCDLCDAKGDVGRSEIEAMDHREIDSLLREVRIG